jgi:hypothetical protein
MEEIAVLQGFLWGAEALGWGSDRRRGSRRWPAVSIARLAIDSSGERGKGRGIRVWAR